MPAAPPTMLGPLYVLQRFVAEGGMGAVLQARDRATRPVALKIIGSKYAGDQEFLAHLRQECENLGALRDPRRVAAVLGFFGPGEIQRGLVTAEPSIDAAWIERVHTSPVLVMGYVPGPTLQELLRPKGKPRPLPVATALSLGVEVAKAIRELHANTPPIEHRDIKPSNIKIARDGRRAVILDLGLSRVCWEAHTTGPPAVGWTLDYAAPEQLCGAPVGTPADVWAFGCVLYRMLTGVLPFDVDRTASPAATASDRAGPPLDWRQRLPGTTPAPVRRLLERCFAPAPEERCSIRAAVLCLQPFAKAHDAAVLNIPTALRRTPTGRAALVNRLARELSSRRTQAVVLEGLPGVGKSRIALAAAARCASMLKNRPWIICHVEPSPGADRPETLATEVLAAMQRMPRIRWRIPDGVLAASALDALSVVLGRRRALLVLDGADGPPEGLRWFLRELAERAPETTLLLTRRSPLDYEGGAPFPVDPLRLPALDGVPSPGDLERTPATRLFLEVARSGLGGATWIPTAREIDAIAHICRDLGGMPWAIAAAASNVGRLSIETIAARLTPLVEHAPDATPAQRLPATIWGLLDPAAQALLTRLSLFPREFSIDAAEHVCADPEAPTGPQAQVLGRPLLWALGELSRLRIIRPVGGDRFRHVEPIRRHAAWMLALPRGGTSGVGDAVEPYASRFLAWFLGLVERGMATGASPDPAVRESWFTQVDVDHENIDAALRLLQTRPEAASQLARSVIALHRYWWSRGSGERAWRWCQRALERRWELPDAVQRSELLKAASVAAMRCDQDQLAEALMLEALEEARRASLPETEAAVQGNLAILMRKRCRWDDAQRHIQAVHELAQRCRVPSVELNARVLEAVIRKLTGDLCESRRLFEGLATELGDARHQVFLLSATQNLGEIDVADGRLRDAVERFRDAWRGQPRAARMDRARAVLWIGIATALGGARTAGLRRIAAAVPLYRSAGGIFDPWLEGWLKRARSVRGEQPPGSSRP